MRKSLNRIAKRGVKLFADFLRCRGFALNEPFGFGVERGTTFRITVIEVNEVAVCGDGEFQVGMLHYGDVARHAGGKRQLGATAQTHRQRSLAGSAEIAGRHSPFRHGERIKLPVVNLIAVTVVDNAFGSEQQMQVATRVAAEAHHVAGLVEHIAHKQNLFR